MKRTFAVTALALSMVLSAHAIRPLHKLFPIKQSDGTTVMLYKHGDSQLDFYTTADHQVVVRDDNGTLCYAQLQGGQLVATAMVCHNEDSRTAAEQAFVAANTLTPREAAMALASDGSVAQSRRAPMHAISTSTSDGLGKYGVSANGAVPSIGEITVPVILVEFSDTKFMSTTTIEKMTRFFNTEGYNEDNTMQRGSVRDYFVAQSRGLFKPTFDVVAKVTLSNGYAYYGKNSGNSQDVNAQVMVTEAIQKAQSQGVDFSKYVVSSKNGVPNVTIMYAGEGEATSEDENTIWPHERDFNRTVGGTTFKSYFVGNEVYGSGDQTRLVGMGVFCHEFSHAMGLPDFYVTDYSYENDNPFGDWSVMDSGSYMNSTYAPVGYTAYERSYMGWLDIPELEDAQSVTLTNPNDTEGQMAVMFRNPSNESEYFILENRQPGTWYSSDLGSGLMVTRICYSRNAWPQNSVNNSQSFKRAMVVTASGRTITDSSMGQASDLFGNGVNNSATFPLYNGSTLSSHEVYRIIDEGDGTLTFSYLDRSLKPTLSADGWTAFERVADASTLAVDDEVIIVNEDDAVALSAQQQGNNRAVASIALANGTAYAGSNVLVMKVKKTSAGLFGFYNEEKKSYLGASSSGIRLSTKADANCIANLSITDGNASIVFTGSSNRKNLGYSADDVWFSCFAAAQGNVQLYRKVDGTTAIKTVDAATTDAPQTVYTIGGQRVGTSLEGLPKGIYIQSGRKVVVR